MSCSKGSAAARDAVGYRFHPTDEEIVLHYLKQKRSGHHDECFAAIAEINVCNFEPWELPGQSKNNSEDKTWYFFGLRDLKYAKSRRSNRTTKGGYWKPTGKVRNVIAKHSKELVGMKRSLVYYKGRPNGTRTGWSMTEFQCCIDSDSPDQADFFMYKLKYKSDEKKHNKHRANGSPSSVSDYENQNLNKEAANSPHGTTDASNVTSDFASDEGTPNMGEAIVDLLQGTTGPKGYITTASDYRNQNLREAAANLPHGTGDSTYNMALSSDYEYQNLHQVAVNLPQCTSELSHSMALATVFHEVTNLPHDASQCPSQYMASASDYENQNSNGTTPLPSEVGDYSPQISMPFDPNQNLNEDQLSAFFQDVDWHFFDFDYPNPEQADPTCFNDGIPQVAPPTAGTTVLDSVSSPELTPQVLEEIKAWLELEESLDSTTFPQQ